MSQEVMILPMGEQIIGKSGKILSPKTIERYKYAKSDKDNYTVRGEYQKQYKRDVFHKKHKDRLNKKEDRKEDYQILCATCNWKKRLKIL